MGTVTAIITISNPYPFLNKKTSYNKRVKFMKRKKLMKFPREQKESGMKRVSWCPKSRENEQKESNKAILHWENWQ